MISPASSFEEKDVNPKDNDDPTSDEDKGPSRETQYTSIEDSLTEESNDVVKSEEYEKPNDGGDTNSQAEKSYEEDVPDDSIETRWAKEHDNVLKSKQYGLSTD